MSQFKVIVSRHVAEDLIKHTAFIAQVSPQAADSFVVEYEKVLFRLEENPLQFKLIQRLIIRMDIVMLCLLSGTSACLLWKAILCTWIRWLIADRNWNSKLQLYSVVFVLL